MDSLPPDCGWRGFINSLGWEPISDFTVVEILAAAFGLSTVRFAVSIAGLPMPHLSGPYQKAIPENRPFALNRRGRECPPKWNFPITNIDRVVQVVYNIKYADCLYARVSTKDKGQDTENQLCSCGSFASSRLGHRR